MLSRRKRKEVESEETPFNQRLKQAMDVQGLNPNQLAGRLSTSASRVASWLAGSNLPGLEHLRKLQGILKVDGHWLLTGEGSMKLRQPGEAEMRLQLIRQLIDAPVVKPGRLVGETSPDPQEGAMQAGQALDNLQADLPPGRLGGTEQPAAGDPKPQERGHQNRA